MKCFGEKPSEMSLSKSCFRGNTPERAERPDRQEALGGNAEYRNATSLSPPVEGPKCIVPDKVNGIVPKDVLKQVCP